MAQNNNNNNNNNVDSLPPNEMKAYYRGLKRGISLTLVTLNLREATMASYSRYPQLRFIRGDPMMVAQDLINATFSGMKQTIPTPQEISLYDITSQEVGINILSVLMNMNINGTTTTSSPTGAPGPKEDLSSKKKQKIPYDKEKAKKSKAFELSDDERKQLR